MPSPEKIAEEKECCGQPMVENGNGTGIRCAKKCGFWEAKPPFIKVEIVSGNGIQRGHRAVLFDDTRITPKKVSPCEVEESWTVNVEDLLENPAISQTLHQAIEEARKAERERCVEVVEKVEVPYEQISDDEGAPDARAYLEAIIAALRQGGGEKPKCQSCGGTGNACRTRRKNGDYTEEYTCAAIHPFKPCPACGGSGKEGKG